MRTRNRIVNTILAVVMIVALGACEKNEQEARKFPRADSGQQPPREQSEVVRYTLDNGVTVFMQEDHSDPRIAIEVVYRAGFAQEPSGQVQVAHITEHAVVYCATAKYKAGEAIKAMQKIGMINAEASGDFVKFDYIVRGDGLEQALSAEADRLTSVQFDAETLAEQAKRAAGEIASALSSDRGTLTKFGFMTLMQAVDHGQTVVPVEAANYQRTVDEVTAFHKERYRVNDMIISIVGNFKIDDAKALVEKYFGGIARTPDPVVYKPTITKNMSVKWDIDGSAFYIVCPGPYDNYTDRIILTMFGSYLSSYLSRNPELFDLTRATYASNQAYPVGSLPFFVFAQPEKYKSLADVRASVTQLFDDAIASVDETMFERIRGAMKNYVTASLIEAQASTQIDYHYILGQHALNLAMKDILKEGRPTEDFVQMLDAITLDQMRQTLAKYLSKDNRFEVAITK